MARPVLCVSSFQQRQHTYTQSQNQHLEHELLVLGYLPTHQERNYAYAEQKLFDHAHLWELDDPNVLGNEIHPKQSISFFDLAFLNQRGLYLPKPIPEEGFLFVVIAFLIGAIAAYFIKKFYKKKHELTGIHTST